MLQTTVPLVASRKDIKSLGALCSSVRWAAKSSVTWLGSPPGNAAHIGQIWNERKESRFTYRWTLIRHVSGWILYYTFYLDQVLTRQKQSRSWTSEQLRRLNKNHRHQCCDSTETDVCQAQTDNSKHTGQIWALATTSNSLANSSAWSSYTVSIKIVF